MLQVMRTGIRPCPACENSSYAVETRQGDFQLCRCQNCGMLYTRNPRTIESKKAYYAEMGKQRKDSMGKAGMGFWTLANQIKSVPLYSQALCKIMELCPSGQVRLVDVGCAGGLFLIGAQIAEDAFNIGQEPRFEVRGVAFDFAEKLDTERYAGCPAFMMEDAGKELRNWADVVSMFNVLEHVNNPKECLSTVRSILRTGGVLVIDVPNNQVVDWRGKLRGRWAHLDLAEHINYFTPKTLDLLLERHRFKRQQRLPGLVSGASGFARRPSLKVRLRWAFATAVFFMTRQKVQLHPNLTAIYRKEA